VQNRLTPDSPPRIYHDTARGIEGRDF